MTKNKFSGGKSQIKFVLLLSILFLFLAFFVLSLSKTSERADEKQASPLRIPLGQVSLIGLKMIRLVLRSQLTDKNLKRGITAKSSWKENFWIMIY